MVVGGGIFGVSVALEASERGLSVCLAEQADFGAGASANSLKTIHGGLRYLQSFDFVSAIISARARKDWLRLFPELVRPLSCVFPTTRSAGKNPLMVGAGLLLYNVLTCWRNAGMLPQSRIPNAHLISKSELEAIAPGLQVPGLAGGAKWFDAQASNTERMLIALLRRAEEAGTLVFNYTPVTRVKKEGALYRVQMDASTMDTVLCRNVVDCSAKGRVLGKAFGIRDELDYVQAVNLVLNKPLVREATGFNTEGDFGRRLMFMAPWEASQTLLGTWYFAGESDAVSAQQVDDMMDQVNAAFDQNIVCRDDVIQVHCGHLPANKAASLDADPEAALIKKAHIHHLGDADPELEGAFRLVGTKWTLARYHAKCLIDKLSAIRGLSLAESRFANAGPASRHNSTASELPGLGLTIEQCRYLERYFSAGLDKIARLVETEPALKQGVPGQEQCIKAAVDYVIQFEHVQRLEDLIQRRLPFGNAGLPEANTLEYCAQRWAELSGNTALSVADEVSDLSRHYMKMAE